ncbi:MAG: hypothetical protein HY898_16420 [Deltaproteobacteria bacterium]|nr:hypothetical protein [Deltaproteobacteria bacterium]
MATAAWLITAGCGSESANNVGEPGGSGASAGDGGSAGTEDAAAGAAGNQQTEIREPNMLVGLAQGRSEDKGGAPYWSGFVWMTNARCTYRVMGACEQRLSCENPLASYTAGTMRISGGKVPVVFEDQSGDGYYDNQQGEGSTLFNPGETLVLKADGGNVGYPTEIPKFEQSVVAPPIPVVTAPSFEQFPPLDQPISIWVRLLSNRLVIT